jgi:DNA-binding transcriptional ArsR family regulator
LVAGFVSARIIEARGVFRGPEQWGRQLTTTSDIFNAIAEPQRREILVLLRAGERPVTELAQELGMTQPGMSKHLRVLVLREVGLVRGRKAGRQRLYGVDARELRLVHEWTGGFERFWNESFGRLDAYVQDLKRERQEK